MRSECHGYTPAWHWRFGIQFAGPVEGARSFLPVERIQQYEALVEESLGLGVPCGNGVMIRSHSLKKNRSPLTAQIRLVLSPTAPGK